MKSRARAFALPLVLWLIVVLMTMVGVIAYSAKLGHVDARAGFDRVESEAAARAGIAYAVARMSPALGEEAWGPALAPREIVLDDWRITLTIRDESGKFDLNRGDPALLAALLQALQMPAEQAAPILAGLDAHRQRALDNDATVAAPAAASPNPDASDADQRILSLGELRQWPGVSSGPLARVREELTVHAGVAQPTWRLASPAMRQALAEIGQAGADTAPASGPEMGSGTYAVESIAQRPGKPPGRVLAVLRVVPGGNGGAVSSPWLAWEHGRWMQ